MLSARLHTAGARRFAEKQSFHCAPAGACRRVSVLEPFGFQNVLAAARAAALPKERKRPERVRSGKADYGHRQQCKPRFFV